MIRPPPSSTLFPYTTLFRSFNLVTSRAAASTAGCGRGEPATGMRMCVNDAEPSSADTKPTLLPGMNRRSEEHTSELQSQSNLVCRLLLEKKKKKPQHHTTLT